MKNKLVIIDVPETCEHCCEDCELFDGTKPNRCDGPVIKGTVLSIDDYLKKYPDRHREVQEIFVVDKPRPAPGKEGK